jgi:hypothetical protein
MLAERVKDWKKQWQEEAQKEGEKEGESKIFVKLLARKFGTIDAETQRRIGQADSEQLVAWAERILTADTIDEVFG